MIPIRQARKLLGLSQKGLGAIVGFNHTAICRWENGDSKPPCDIHLYISQLAEEQVKESAFQRATLELLQVRGYWSRRMPGAPVIHGAGDNKRFAQSPIAGCPDIMLFLKTQPSQCAFLELKVGRGKVSENQQKWIEEMTVRRVPVAVCRTLDHVEEALNKWEQQAFDTGGVSYSTLIW